jgi:glutamate racemase
MNCKLIVVACNTATNAIRELRAKYDIPFIGIEPAIKPPQIKKQEKLAF